MSVLEEMILIKESEMNRYSGKLKSQRLTKGMPNKVSIQIELLFDTSLQIQYCFLMQYCELVMHFIWCYSM